MYLVDRTPLAGGRRQDRRPRRTERVAGTVILMGIVSMITDVSSESVSAILALYLTTVVGLSPLAYGFIDGLYQGISALVRILGGWAADRSDHPKWIALSGYVLSAVTRIALIPAQGLAAITTVIAVDRLGKGIRTAPRDSVIAASSTSQNLGKSFGVHRALDTLGAVIGPFIAFAILYTLPGDYRAVFVVSFAAAIIGVAVLLFLVPDVRPARAEARLQAHAPTNTNANADDSPVAVKVIANRPFRMVMLATGLLGILTIGDGFLYLALQHRSDLAIKYFPLLYVGTNFAYMAQALPLGRLADRVGKPKVFLAGHLALIAAYLCAGGPITGPAVTIACLLFLGTYYAATDGQLAAMASRLFDSSARGSAIATAQTVQALARFASSFMFGAIWTFTSQSTAILSVAAVLAMTVPSAWLLLRNVDSRTPSAAAVPTPAPVPEEG